MVKQTYDFNTNKLNIYLIKEKYSDEDSIIKIDTDKEINKIEINNVGIFYFKKSSPNPPDWLSSFFNNHPSIESSNFFGSGTKAVLIIKIPHKSKIRFFAIPFGSGRFLLKDFCFEERFGLITSLNILESKSIRGIDKRTLTTNPKSSREQIAKASEAIDFQIDFERDLVQSITGKSTDTTFGNIVTGKEALSISAKVDITNIKSFLKRALNTFEKKDYRINFKWIDQIKEVRIDDTIDKLNENLIKRIINKDEAVWLAVPEIVDWANFKGFKYSTRKRDTLHEELDLITFIDEIGITLDSIEQLENNVITCWGVIEDGISHKWSIFSCLNAEIDLNKKKYFLANSKWYEINSEFVKSVDDIFNSIEQINIVHLPDYNHKDEGEYNTAAATQINALCLDAKNLPYGGGHSKIEFCDIFTKDKKLIHVKKDGGSSVLSHLFNQGYVSAELLLSDEVFRKKVITELLTDEYKSIISETKPNANDCTSSSSLGQVLNKTK
ncbi:MAG: TIGR04141 family sporadically distributed protein [Bacteroidota bacterium]|jgi:uncharacterized protein (TIGR04141 family)